MNNMIALLKRESWEHPALWVVPAVFAALMLLIQVIVLFALDRISSVPMQELADLIVRFAELETGDRRALIKSFTIGIAMPFNVFLVGIMFFYALGSLYDDRRDRSILFWKSLPVSDVETVLSKLVAISLLAPVMTLAVIVVFTILSLALGSVIAMSVGGGGWYLAWDPVALTSAWLTLLWAFFAQSMVYLPMIAWVMLASAWAKRAPFLWAVGPPVAVIIVEAIYTGKTWLGSWLLRRFSEGLPLAMQVNVTGDKVDISHVQGQGVQTIPVEVSFALLGSGMLWSGVAVAAVLLAGATWLRRYRAEAE